MQIGKERHEMLEKYTVLGKIHHIFQSIFVYE